MPIVRVALDVPLDRLFDYRAEDAVPSDVGRRVRVPFGRQRKMGVILAVVDETASTVTTAQLKRVEEILREDAAEESGSRAGLAPLPPDWLALCQFAAQYYQEPVGEVIAQALPPGLKQMIDKKRRAVRKEASTCKKNRPTPLSLTPEQAVAVEAVAAAFGGFKPFLLHGVTGSGKTEVYLRLIEQALARHAGTGQALLLVPEINLTPQLETRVSAHFPDVLTVGLHSELSVVSI